MNSCSFHSDLELHIEVTSGGLSAIHMSKREHMPSRFRRHWDTTTDRTLVAVDPDAPESVIKAANSNAAIPAGRVVVLDLPRVDIGLRNPELASTQPVEGEDGLPVLPQSSPRNDGDDGNGDGDGSEHKYAFDDRKVHGDEDESSSSLSSASSPPRALRKISVAFGSDSTSIPSPSPTAASISSAPIKSSLTKPNLKSPKSMLAQRLLTRPSDGHSAYSVNTTTYLRQPVEFYIAIQTSKTATGSTNNSNGTSVVLSTHFGELRRGPKMTAEAAVHKLQECVFLKPGSS